MLTVVHNAEASTETAATGGSLLDEIVRDGARQLLAAALRAEVAAYIEAHAAEVDADGHRLVVRNGYHAEREVTTAAGAVPVRQPRVNDKRVDEETGQPRRFSSAILPAWARKSPQVAEVLPLLHLHGLSSWSRWPTGSASPPSPGPTCCATASAAGCGGRCSPSATVRWVLENPPRRLPPDPRAALLLAHDRQRALGAAQVRAPRVRRRRLARDL